MHKCKCKCNLILVVNEVKLFSKISDAEYKKLKHHICVYSHSYVSSLTAGQECFMPKPEPPPWALPGSSVQNGHIHLHKITKHTGDHLPCHKTTRGKVKGPPSLKGIKKIHIWFFLLLLNKREPLHSLHHCFNYDDFCFYFWVGIPPPPYIYSSWFHSSNQFIHLFYCDHVLLLCLETRFKQTLTAGRWARVNHKEKVYAMFSEVEIYSHLWYQQTGTPGRHHQTKRHAALKTQFPDLILSVISSSDNKP